MSNIFYIKERRLLIIPLIFNALSVTIQLYSIQMYPLNVYLT